MEPTSKPSIHSLGSWSQTGPSRALSPSDQQTSCLGPFWPQGPAMPHIRSSPCGRFLSPGLKGSKVGSLSGSQLSPRAVGEVCTRWGPGVQVRLGAPWQAGSRSWKGGTGWDAWGSVQTMWRQVGPLLGLPHPNLTAGSSGAQDDTQCVPSPTPRRGTTTSNWPHSTESRHGFNPPPRRLQVMTANSPNWQM